MSKLERCDVVVGTGETIVTAGAYKVGEDTRYKYGICLNVPAQTELGLELADKIYNVGLHRVMSVAAAGTFNKASDYGTKEDAEAFAAQFSTIEGWQKAFEKARRAVAEKVDTVASLALKILAKVLREKQAADAIATASTPVPEAPLTEKGQVNYPAWAKKVKEADHPWYATALKKAGATDKGFD